MVENLLYYEFELPVHGFGKVMKKSFLFSIEIPGGFFLLGILFVDSDFVCCVSYCDLYVVVFSQPGVYDLLGFLGWF